MRDGSAVIWDVNTGKTLRKLKGDENGDPFSDLATSADGRFIIKPSMFDLPATIWDTRSGERVITLMSFNSGWDSLVFAPDGRQSGYD